MEDIKPVLPNGLGIPEKDISKYAFGGWNPTSKDEKPPSDEMLLLPNSRATVSTDTKQKDESNCGASDHTDSTVLSDASRGPVERQASTSDEGSNSSMHLEIEPVRAGSDAPQDEEDCSCSDTEVSHESSPYFSNKDLKKNPTSGYVQQPIVNPATGYVQSAAAPMKSPPPMVTPQPASSSYVMAALSPPIFTTGVAPPSLQRDPPTSSGYVRPEDAQARSMLHFSNNKSSPAKMFGPESLPIMPTLPAPTKHGADSSYIQLQSLPSHKQPVQNNVPLKPAASSGYVSPGDAVINKHLNNMLSAGQLAEESAILDPMMSPDAYCRFSWSTDPANDNLHSLLANSPTLKTTKN